MKFAILFVLYVSIVAVSCFCPLCQQRNTPQNDPFGFNDPNISNTDMKNYFVRYVNAMNGIRIDVLRSKTPDQLVAMAINELLKRLETQPDQTQLIRLHIQYFNSYRNRPVPQAPFVDFNKDLSKLSAAELRVYLIGYLHALSGISEVELRYKQTPELLDRILGGLTARFHENRNKDPHVTDLVRKHYEFFARLKK